MDIFGDLHIHSIVSDGSLHPSEIVKISKAKSIQVVSITDHNTFLGSVIGSKYIDRRSQIIIHGAEVRTHIGDVLVLCPQPNFISGRDLLSLIDLCRDNNCLLIPSHPYDVLRLGIRGNVSMKVWNAIEVFNGSSDLLSNMVSYILTKDIDIPHLSNSDAHVGYLIGSAYNIIDVNDFNADSVLDSIRKGRVIPIMRYSIKGNIKRVGWGLKRFVNGYKPISLDRLNKVFK